MRTRNQLSNKVSSETSNNAINQSDKGSPTESTFNSSPSPPRLRDNRSHGKELRSIPASTTIPCQSPSPPAGVKRLSTGPTRILPRRSCGRPISLLAGTPSNSNAINSSLNNKCSSILSKSPEQTSSKKDTHREQLTPTSSLPESSEINCVAESELLATNKTVSEKNCPREIPLTRSAVLPKHSKHENNLKINNDRTKLVRISLPDNTCTNAGKSSDILSLTKSNSLDKNRYMFTINGLKKIGTIDTETTEVIESTSSIVGDESDKDESSSQIPNSDSPEKIFNVLLCVTGSVATIKLVELIQKIKSMFPQPYISKPNGSTVEASIKIKIVMTHNSKHFAPKEELIKNLNDSSIDIYDDTDEWALWKKIGDPVLHIELRKWADLCLIAPLDANTMAKLANGICDNLLTCVIRAWDVSKPLVYCPAMNVHMYNHPITREQLCKLQSFGYLRVDCVEKRLACGDFGLGGMAPIDSISNKVIDSLFQPVTRKVSLSKPLLNQQPTYPIISTSGDREEPNQSNTRFQSSISSQILKRFRTNNQITIHAVPNTNLRSYQSLESDAIDTIDELSLKGRRKMNPGDSEDYFIGNDKRQNRPYAIHHSSSNNNNRQKMGGVTSVQNLKAIGVDNGEMDEPGYNACEEDVGFDFDPSKLLEQTMITDESMTFEHDTRNATFTNPGHSLDRNSSFSEESIAKMGGLTPLFNTSKFLALCHNKERGCFTCTICKHDYKNRKSMARHLKEQHVQGNIYQCKPCGVSYKRREKLIKHNRERHPGIQ